jgi:group I intron endonuclease
MINTNDLPNLGGVYKIISPSNKIYIGKTKNIRKRFLKYSKLICEQQTKFYNSFLKYGFENHNVEILFLSDDNQILCETEIFYIQQFQTFNTDNGLNLTKGGDGRSGKHSLKTKNKISEGLRNSEKLKKTMSTIEYREKLSKSLMNHPGYNKGLKRKKEDIEKIKIGVKKHIEEFGSRKHTDISKQKMSEKRKNENNANSKKRIIKYKNEVISFNCQKYLKDYLNILNEKLKLKGPNRFSYDGLIKKGYTKEIILVS